MTATSTVLLCTGTGAVTLSTELKHEVPPTITVTRFPSTLCCEEPLRRLPPPACLFTAGMGPSATSLFLFFFFCLSHMQWIHDLKPLVFTVIGVDGNLNSHSYLERVGEVLRLTTAILENFDSTVHDLATSTDRPAAMSMEHLVMGQLMNCVSSEGLAQTMRAENMRQWQERLASMGFERVPLGPNVFTALEGASLHPRLSVLPVQGCASLRWDGSPLVFALTARSPGTT